MKISKFLGKFVTVVFVSVLLLNCTGEVRNDENEQGSKAVYAKSSTHEGAQYQQAKSSTTHSIKKAKPFDILFGVLWPFEEGTISYETSEDKRVLILNGSSINIIGVVCWERKVSLKGNRTLEIEILDLGNSSFSSGKMLKVIIWNVPGGAEIPLICKDDMKQSDDPEYVLASTGLFQYSLDSATDDAIYKLAFVFYNTRLEGFKLRARFVE